MKIISEPVKKDIILEKYNNFFNEMIKADVDTKKELIAVDGELHADLEKLLIQNGSKQEDIWGINLYLKKNRENWIEYTSLINIRPSRNNKSMEIQDTDIRDRVRQIIEHLILE